MHREPSEDPTIDKWILQSVKTQMEALNFVEGSEILPEAEGTTPAAEVPPTGEKTPEAEKPAPKDTH